MPAKKTGRGGTDTLQDEGLNLGPPRIKVRAKQAYPMGLTRFATPSCEVFTCAKLMTHKCNKVSDLSTSTATQQPHYPAYIFISQEHAERFLRVKNYNVVPKVEFDLLKLEGYENVS